MAILDRNRTLVTAAENMSDRTFTKHMQLRHSDSTGYLRSFAMTLGSPYLMRMWRAFHRQLHKFRIDLEHEHGTP